MSVRPFLLLCCLVLIVASTAASPVVQFTPAPIHVVSITPSEAIPGSTGQYVVRGTGFWEGASFAIWCPETGIVISTDAYVIDSWTLRGNLSIPISADLGSYSLYAVNPSSSPTGSHAEKLGAFTVIAPLPGIIQVPEGAGVPTDADDDREYDDVNGNGRVDFADVVLYFNQMGWIAANEPVSAFDYNDNGSIDFADIVWLFNHL